MGNGSEHVVQMFLHIQGAKINYSDSTSREPRSWPAAMEGSNTVSWFVNKKTGNKVFKAMVGSPNSRGLHGELIKRLSVCSSKLDALHITVA